ncbi:N-acetyltransferase [Acanthopleuribacter pedis]
MITTDEFEIGLPEGHLLRDAAAEDAAAVAEIYNQAVRRGGATMDTVEKTEAVIQAQLRRLDAREFLLVLEGKGVMLGWGAIKRYSDREGYRFACETSVYIHIAYLRRGYGSLVKRALIARSRRLGYRHLVAKVFAENQASIDCNLKLGFEVVGTQKQIGFMGGRWHDVVIMQFIQPHEPEAGSAW